MRISHDRTTPCHTAVHHMRYARSMRSQTSNGHSFLIPSKAIDDVGPRCCAAACDPRRQPSARESRDLAHGGAGAESPVGHGEARMVRSPRPVGWARACSNAAAVPVDPRPARPVEESALTQHESASRKLRCRSRHTQRQKSAQPTHPAVRSRLGLGSASLLSLCLIP